MNKRIYFLAIIAFISGMVELIISGILDLMAGHIGSFLSPGREFDYYLFINLCHFFTDAPRVNSKNGAEKINFNLSIYFPCGQYSHSFQPELCNFIYCPDYSGI